MDARRLYEARLAKSGKARMLARELALEDAYRRQFTESLASSGMPGQMIEQSYQGWRAFTGDGAELQTAVANTATAVAQAAATTEADVPPYYCGLWPDVSLNAATLATPHGNVVFVHSALLVALRCVTQEVAYAFDELHAGIIGEKSKEASAAIGALLARHLSGVDIRHNYEVRVLGGPREFLRREMMWGALCYTIAHEAGHLARRRHFQGRWTDDNGAFQVRAKMDDHGELMWPQDEIQALRGHNAERIADSIAATILREPPCSPSGVIRPGFMLGAMSVLLLQAALWWRTAALTDRPLGWIHPLVDMRAAGLGRKLGQAATAPARPESADPAQGMKATQLTELEKLAETYRSWADETLAIDQCRARVHQRGLGGRGLNAATLAAIYMTDPDMPQQPSDVLAALRVEKGT